MTPEELLEQTLEIYPENPEFFDLDSATNYLDAEPNGDPHGYYFYAIYNYKGLISPELYEDILD